MRKIWNGTYITVYDEVETLTVEEADILMAIYEAKGECLRFMMNDGKIVAVVTRNI